MPVHRARAERRARWNEAEGNEHGQFTAPVHHRKDGETGAAHPELLTPVLGIVHRVITGFLVEQAGLRRGAADAGRVTLIQRFGSGGNLNIHLHCLVLAPNAKLRGAVIPQPAQKDGAPGQEDTQGQAARMRWARLLKRVFDIDVERCACGGQLNALAAIEEPVVIVRILTHLGLAARAPPRAAVWEFLLDYAA